MKVLGIFFVIAVCSLINSTSGQIIKPPINKKTLSILVTKSLSDKLGNFLEHQLRRMMIDGNDDLNFPVMDPLHGFDQQIDFTLNDMMMSGKLHEYHAVGLASYEVKESTINSFKRMMAVGMNFPTITGHGRYNLDSFIGESTSIYGAGDFNITCTDFYYSAVAYFSIFGGLRVKSLDLKISLKELDLSMSGLMNDDETSWILSEVVSEMIPKAIDEYQKEIVASISPKLMKMINDNLEGKSLTDLLGLLG